MWPSGQRCRNNIRRRQKCDGLTKIHHIQLQMNDKIVKYLKRVKNKAMKRCKMKSIYYLCAG